MARYVLPTYEIRKSFLGESQLPRENSTDKSIQSFLLGFPGGAVVENLPANAGDTGSSPGLGRSHMLRSN